MMGRVLQRIYVEYKKHFQWTLARGPTFQRSYATLPWLLLLLLFSPSSPHLFRYKPKIAITLSIDHQGVSGSRRLIERRLSTPGRVRRTHQFPRGERRMNGPLFLRSHLLDNTSSNTGSLIPFVANWAGIALDKVKLRLFNALRASGKVAAAWKDAIHLRDFVWC